MFDPFRLQFLTVSLDSEAVLVVLGVVLAGLASREAAGRMGLPATRLWDATLEVAVLTIGSARVGWVVTHLEYYVRAPLQLVVVGDGGFLFGTGELAAALLVWRHQRRLGLSWAEMGAIVAPAFAIALLLDRTGCALTACGDGLPASVPWALIRSGVALHPVGLYGVIVWLIAWLTLRGRGVRRVRRERWLVLIGTVGLERALAWAFGHEGFDGFAVSGALVALVGLIRWRADLARLRRRSRG